MFAAYTSSIFTLFETNRRISTIINAKTKKEKKKKKLERRRREEKEQKKRKNAEEEEEGERIPSKCTHQHAYVIPSVYDVQALCSEK